MYLGGNGDDTVVRALASHQRGPGSIPKGDTTIMWVEFVVDSRPCSEGFSPSTSFLLPQTTNASKFQFDPETVELRATSWIPLKFLFIILFYDFFLFNFIKFHLNLHPHSMMMVITAVYVHSSLQ